MTATQTLPLDELWTRAPYYARRFDPDLLDHHPEPVRRFLSHAIPPHVVLASAVRLKMHGEIQLRGWCPFTAQEVISWNTGMIWRARVRRGWSLVTGFDSCINGRGMMQWKLFGLFPLLRAAGPDITRSAAGRVNAEVLWLPSALVGPGVLWSVTDGHHIRATFHAHGDDTALDLAIDDIGRLRSFSMLRWGNPDQGPFRLCPFGGVVEEECEFGGFTIPSRMRIGWYPTPTGFEGAGEFLQVEVDDAHYR